MMVLSPAAMAEEISVVGKPLAQRLRVDDWGVVLYVIDDSASSRVADVRLAQSRSPSQMMVEAMASVMWLGARRFTSPKFKLRDRVSNTLPDIDKFEISTNNSLSQC
jgi:hypothetical protein